MPVPDDVIEEQARIAQRLRQQQEAARDKYLDRDDRDDRVNQRFDRQQYERENP